MTTFPTKKILPAAIIIFVIGAILYQLSHRSPLAQGPSTATTTATSTKPSVVTPPYKEPIAFAASVSPEIRTELTNQLTEIQKEIDVNPLHLQAWLNLGAVYKMGGDYPHAITAWNFIIEVTPNSPGPYYNLGDLYMNFVKDYPKAEENYKKVIALKPTAVGTYHELYNLYRYRYKTDTTAAQDIVTLGLKNNPGNAELLELQAELNKK
jgi:tetratricopeptide (TPR) repeat protein